MGREILRQLPDGEIDYDGEEQNDIEYQDWLEDWRFEMSTYNY